MTKTLQEILDESRAAKLAAVTLRSKWRADQPLREQEACERFRAWLAEVEGIALGDDAVLSAEEQNAPEPGQICRSYRVKIDLPAIAGGCEVTVCRYPQDMGMERGWYAYTQEGLGRMFPELGDALMWLTDDGAMLLERTLTHE